MRTGFIDIPSRAMINLTQGSHNVYTVNRVSVPRAWPSNRGKGIASRLFAEVCAEADREAVTLILFISPDGTSGSLDMKQLADWYQRLGFRHHDEIPGWWKRLPKTQQPC
jgi:predicted GNAT family acetyltransferase